MKWQTIQWQTLQWQSYITEFFYQSWFVFRYLWRSSIGILKSDSKCSSDRQSDRNSFLSTLIWLQSYIPNDSWSYLCIATLARAYFSFLVVSICNPTMHLFIPSLSLSCCFVGLQTNVSSSFISSLSQMRCDTTALRGCGLLRVAICDQHWKWQLNFTQLLMCSVPLSTATPALLWSLSAPHDTLRCLALRGQG